MDAKHFDAWTRRRFGLAAGSAIAALFALRDADHVGARKRRCKKLGRACAFSGGHCCGKLQCDYNYFTDSVPNDTFCCKPDGASCTSHESCCSTYCEADTDTCKTCRGRDCTGQPDCCPQWGCEKGFCGGCADFGQGCNAEHPCCADNGACDKGFCGGCVRTLDPTDPTSGNPPCPQNGAYCCDTDCTGGVCVSQQGGPCARNVDCRTCYENFPNQCDGACDLDTHTCV